MHPLMTEIMDRTKQAMKQRDTISLNLYRVIVGHVDNICTRDKVNERQLYDVMKKLIEGNNLVLSHMKENDSRVETLVRENELLNELIPASYTFEEIENLLTPFSDMLMQASSEKQAMGLAMKNLSKCKDKILAGDVVLEVVKQKFSQK